MNDTHAFTPPQRNGTLFQAGAIALLIGATAWGLWKATSAQVGPIFLLYLLPALIAVPAVPILAYRLYILRNASYHISRDDLRIQWGLRIERIPADAILWVRPAADLRIPLQLPLLHWPGSILGIRRLPDGRPVEFLASQANTLILIGTAQRVYAISPANPQEFIQIYQRFFELGSLNPVEPESSYPGFLFARVWGTFPARFSLVFGALVNLILPIWGILAVPRHTHISLGFTPSGLPREPLPSIQLMFIPVFSIFIYLTNGTLGLFFYRSRSSRPWAYLLWLTSDLTATLFLMAVYFILRTN